MKTDKASEAASGLDEKETQRHDRVYKFGCRAPREHDLAVQLLGQASNYAEDLRRAYNDRKRDMRALLDSRDDASHVVAYGYDRLKAAIRLARQPSRRGRLVDAGTYWLVEAAMLAANKASGRDPMDPIKRRLFDGTGRVGAAIPSVQQFLATREDGTVAWEHPRVRLTTPDGRRHAELTIVVGALAEATEITWPIKLHRPFPAGAIVKQVAVQRTRVGHRFRWEALVTISYASEERRDVQASGVVGVDVGWRSEDVEGKQRRGTVKMRVATHDGGSDRGVLLIDTAEAFAYSDAVRGFRDLNFDVAKEYLYRSGIPGTEHAKLWRDKDRMRRVQARLVTARAPEDLGVAMWQERDRHLEDIECGVRARAMRRRLDAFRAYADGLARRYRRVVLEDMPMLDWVGEGETSGLERRRSIASLGLLQLVIGQRFGPERTDWAPCAYTSMTCSACGTVRDEPVGPKARWACECGAVHHQDENAATVLRRLGERWGDAGNPPRARTRKAKRGDRKRVPDGVATGDDLRMVVAPREPQANAAE